MNDETQPRSARAARLRRAPLELVPLEASVGELVEPVMPVLSDLVPDAELLFDVPKVSDEVDGLAAVELVPVPELFIELPLFVYGAVLELAAPLALSVVLPVLAPADPAAVPDEPAGEPVPDWA